MPGGDEGAFVRHQSPDTPFRMKGYWWICGAQERLDMPLMALCLALHGSLLDRGIEFVTLFTSVNASPGSEVPMSPIRYEDDYRRKEIDDWDTWIEDEIRGAQERGEFSDLPHQGKPIEIYRTDLNPEYDLAFSRLKNAGVMPAWMELDRDVSRMAEELDAYLERSAAYLVDQRALLMARLAAEKTAIAPPVRDYPRWQVWRSLLDWFRDSTAVPDVKEGPASLGDLLTLRQHMRAQYLGRAETLDKKIADYHNALPQGLSHLQRLRMLPNRAARRFDERFPVSMVLDGPAGEERVGPEPA